ncbi:MAG: alpha/beta hydrolase [Anaerolineales bacterium]
MKKVSVNGLSIAYERSGKGVPLVLIHGYPLDHSIWRETSQLLENDFDVILPDMRGFGESSSLNQAYSVSDMADDLAGLLDAIHVEKIALAGHSMGGYVALTFAKKYPERVSGLALVSSQAAADSEERKQGRYKTAEDVALNGVLPVADAMAGKLSSDKQIQDYSHELIKKQSKEGVIGALKAMAEREDMLAFLVASQLNLVLVHGDADALIPLDRAKEIKQARSSSTLIELPGLGHMPMMEAPEKVAQALKLLK